MLGALASAARAAIGATGRAAGAAGRWVGPRLYTPGRAARPRAWEAKPARGLLPNLGRGAAKALEYGWQLDSVLNLVGRVANLPSMSHSISVQAIGDVNTDLRKLHWYCMSVALGRVDISAAAANPYTVICMWNVRQKKVTVQLGYVIANLPFVPILASVVTNEATQKALKASYEKIVAGPVTDSKGGQYPDWLKTAALSAGVDPSTLKAHDGTMMTNTTGTGGFGLPYSDGTRLLRLEATDAGKDAPNPGPPIKDGVRSSLLSMATAALLADPRTPYTSPPPTDEKTSYPRYVKNTFNTTTDRRVGPGVEDEPPPNTANTVVGGTNLPPGNVLSSPPLVETPGGPVNPPTGGGY